MLYSADYTLLVLRPVFDRHIKVTLDYPFAFAMFSLSNHRFLSTIPTKANILRYSVSCMTHKQLIVLVSSSVAQIPRQRQRPRYVPSCSDCGCSLNMLLLQESISIVLKGVDAV